VPRVGTLALAVEKKALHDSQRDTPRVKGLRQAFQQQMTDQPVLRLKFCDEAGVHLGMTQLYGRATPGQRVSEGTPDYSGAHYTIVSTLGWDGVTAPWVFQGPMTSQAFVTYISAVLAPTLQPGDILLIDNLSAHSAAEASQAIEARGAKVIFLPPYSSDFNPIELCWSKVKAALRMAKARTWDALLDALATALRSVTDQDARAWFAHCGYTVH
jgi:transposase